MNAHALRRQADIARLHQMAACSGGRMQVVDAPERAGRPIRIRLDLCTVPSARFPQERQQGVLMRFDLPARYPFERPVITIETPVFHPNVFSSGVVCQGEKWLPSHGMDVIVRRMIDLLSFAPLHVNPASAANRTAAQWYLSMLDSTPSLFPTDRLQTDRLQTDERVIRTCTHCGRSLRLPAGRSGTVQCPACRQDFAVST